MSDYNKGIYQMKFSVAGQEADRHLTKRTLAEIRLAEPALGPADIRPNGYMTVILG